MNKTFILLVFLYLTLFNVEALRKKNTMSSTSVAAATPPPSGGSFLQGKEETTDFELINFYEYTFYVQAYILYDEYVLNTGLGCSAVKKQYWFDKKTDAASIASFCSLIGSQIGSSYLSGYLCAYISGLIPYFNSCSD